MTSRTAYLPLDTYPEALPDDAIQAAVGFAGGLGVILHAATYAVDVPQPGTPFGSVLLDVGSLVRAAEEKSRHECARLQELVRAHAGQTDLRLATCVVRMGTAAETAAVEARYFDLAVLPWSAAGMASQEMAQAVIFGSGRPSILVPPQTRPAPLDHVAIAWDESRVAARALGDAIGLLVPGAKVTVLTAKEDKPLAKDGMAETLVAALELRGIAAQTRDVVLDGGTIAEALQAAAVDAGARMLAMGGFGHSRIRDFVLGGATKGVLANLRLPTLLSH